MEVKDHAICVARRRQISLTVGATFGFLIVLLIGIASADDTPTSAPVQPDIQLASAVVVAAGADNIDPNTVAKLTIYKAGTVEYGTSFRVDDGRIATVAHALIDARGVGLGEGESELLVPLSGGDAAPSKIDRVNDVASFIVEVTMPGLTISETWAQPGDVVALAGFPRGGRMEIVTGEIIARTSGADYGIERTEVYAIAAPVTEGWSGGPVVNGLGEVVAIVIATEAASGVTLAVPISYLPIP